MVIHYSQKTASWCLKSAYSGAQQRNIKHRATVAKASTTGLCGENPPVAGGSPHKGPVKRKVFQCHDVIMCCFVFQVPPRSEVWQLSRPWSLSKVVEDWTSWAVTLWKCHLRMTPAVWHHSWLPTCSLKCSASCPECLITSCPSNSPETCSCNLLKYGNS